MKITTMNVNGIRAAFRKGLDTWLENHDADLLCLQEVRASAEDACALLGPAWDTRVWECRIKGRAGVALALRRDSGFSWGEAVCGLGEAAYGGGEEPAVDTGRWLESAVRTVGGRQLRLVSAYLHSGSLDTPKQTEKMAYLQRIQHRVMDLGAAARTNPPDAPGGQAAEVLVCGDFNIVRTATDIKNWKSNHNKTSGVMDEEIAYLDAWMSDELSGSEAKPCVDVVRALHPEGTGPYTWWSQRGKAFDNDAGWRLDYQMASPGLATTAQSFEVWRAPAYDQRFSDHAPLSVTYDFD